MAEKHPCGDLFISIGNEIYKSTVFNRFFEKNDPIVMGWAENVLAKLTAEGILPTFLQKRDNEDFKTYWGTIAHMFALAVVYARKYKDVDSNKILFEAFIQNKGITTDLIDSQEQMEYLFYNYLTEYSKRGRLDIISTEGTVLGELLRLIRYNSTDEFIFTLLQPQNTGWVTGSSSPSWKRTNTIENITKAYEFTEDIIDLSKYPLLRSSNVQLVSDKNSENESIQAMSFIGNQPVGIQGDSSQRGKYILIDPSLSYEITLKVKINGLLDQNLKFGVTGFNSNFSQINFSVLKNTEYESESNWFHSNSFLKISETNLYYELKGIVLAYNQRYLNAPVLNFLSGRALSMQGEMKYICPVFIQERASISDPLIYLYDFKVKPLNLPFEQGYLGARDIIASYYKNNAFQKESSVNLFLKKYLLSYKNIFNGKILTPLEESQLTFKVFSNRNQYLNRATVTINGKSYQTNVNGEITIKIYPGVYTYDVTAEGFNSIKGSVLEIDNSSKVEYIQMTGAVYKRTVVFSVKSVNVPIEGARVTFNGNVGFTGANGLAFFEAFPGIYEYKVEKVDFTTVTRNVSITDDTTIDVDLTAIPYYKVSFRVRDGELPVAGAAVVLTGDFDGDGNITEQTGSTNALGVATGFVMRAGTYQYRISKDAFITKSGDFSIVNDATIDIPLTPVPKYDVTFVVKSNALPIQGAVVTFNGVQKTTDVYGKAVFKEPNGEYHYSVTKKEFLTQSGSIIVNGANVTKNIEFVQIGYIIHFFVKTGVSGTSPLDNVAITMGSETIMTNTSGEAEFIRVSGNYNWTTAKTGYYPSSGSVLVNGEAKTQNVSMALITYNANITVRINGNIVSGQPVICNGIYSNTDSQGIARFNLPPGTYGWSVTREGYDSQSGTILLVDRDNAINVDLAATKGTIILTAKDSETKNPLNGVAVTVNGETKYTAATGQVSFILVLGLYDFASALTGYNANSGTFEVKEGISNKEILMVKEAAKVWSLTFVASTGPAALGGVKIEISGGQSGITNTAGRVVFSVISGEYEYKATPEGFFIPLTGTTRVSESNTTVPLSFVRKTTEVSFRAIDYDTLEDIQGASIIFLNITKTTNALGWAYFPGVPMSSESLPYVATKKPPYVDVSKTVVVNTENPKVNIYMGQLVYDIIFTVKTNTGTPIEGASILINGYSRTTNSLGQATSPGQANGTYNYTASHVAYQTVTGSVTVLNGIEYVNITMLPLTNVISYFIQFTDGTPIPGISVKVGGETKATDSVGHVVFFLKSGSYDYSIAKDSYYIPITGTLVVGDINQTITKVLEDVFVIEVDAEANKEYKLPILNTAAQKLPQLKIDWGDGSVTTGTEIHTYGATEIKIIKIGFGLIEGTLEWSCFEKYVTIGDLNFARKIRRILQWFQKISHIHLIKGAFEGCINLTSLGTIKGSQVWGTTQQIFNNCSSLATIPTGFFKWNNDGNLYLAFQQTALSGNIDQSFFEGITNVVDFQGAFSESKISSFTAVIPTATPISALKAFFRCTSLRSCNAFFGETKINDLGLAFLGCTSLDQWPTISLIDVPVSMQSTFQGCTAFTSNTIPNYLPRKLTGGVGVFRDCTNIVSFAAGLFPDTVTNLNDAFFNCKALVDITPTKLPIAPKLTSCISMYEGCESIITIPDNFFQGQFAIQYFNAAFRDCFALRWIGVDMFFPSTIFEGCCAIDVGQLFQNCFNLEQKKYGLINLFSPSPLTQSTQCILRYCKNYTGCFMGCAKIDGFPRVISGGASGDVRQLYQAVGTSLYGTSGEFLFNVPNARGEACFRGCNAYYVGLGNVPLDWR